MDLSQRLSRLFLQFGFKRLKESNNLPPFYQVYPPTLPITLLDILGIISHRYQFAYFRIFKAANSTIVSSLYNAETSQAVTSLVKLQEIKDSYYKHPSSLSFKQITQLQESYFKFTFVRNPYTRVLAAYLDKIVSNAAGKRDIVAKFLDKPINSEVSFDEFLYYLENGGITRNAHWARQCDLLPVPLNKLDFIGKIENLSNDLEYVLNSIFGVHKPIISVREHATKASPTFNKTDVDIKKRIYRLYNSDFDLFNYCLDD